MDLSKLRKEKKYTQAEFAEKLGYSRSAIATFETGKQPMTDAFLDKLHEVFGIDVEEYKSYNKPRMDNKLKESLQEEMEMWKAKYYQLMEEHLKVMKELKELEHERKSKVELSDKHVSK